MRLGCSEWTDPNRVGGYRRRQGGSRAVVRTVLSDDEERSSPAQASLTTICRRHRAWLRRSHSWWTAVIEVQADSRASKTGQAWRTVNSWHSLAPGDRSVST